MKNSKFNNPFRIWEIFVFTCALYQVDCTAETNGTSSGTNSGIVYRNNNSHIVVTRSNSQSGQGNVFLNPLYGNLPLRGSGFTTYSSPSPTPIQYSTTVKRLKKKAHSSSSAGDDGLRKNEQENIESKTHDEIPDQLAVESTSKNEKPAEELESRGCPTCTSGDCSPNTVISGLPAIQILIALGAGVICSAIFVILYKNLIETGSSSTASGGYGYAAAQPQMQYGTPQSQYGAPQSQYSSPSRSGYGRSFGNFDFNQLSNFVWKAFEKFSDSNTKAM